MILSKLTTNNCFQLKKLYRSSVNLMLTGPAGCAKSTVVEMFAKKVMEFGFVELILSQIEGVDARGIMVPKRNEDGTADTISTRTPLRKLVLDEIARTGKQGGIIFLDEYYQAPTDVRKAFTGFLSTKPHRIGEWNLPEGWVIWGASNPPEWRAGTSKPMGHEPSRWTEVVISPDPEAFSTWAYTAGVHHLYISYAEKFAHEVFKTDPPKDRGAPHQNSRSLIAAHDFHTLGVTDNTLPTDALTQEIVAGSIGVAAAGMLMGFLKVQDVMPSPEEMLANPTTCKIPPLERIDARYACMMQAVHYSSPEKNEALFAFVNRLDKELTLASIKHFIRKDPVSLNSPSIAAFIAANPESVMALAQVR